MRLIRLALAGVALTTPLHLSAQQAAPPASSAKVLVNVDRHGVALEGYDPVAFFTDSAAVRGDSTHRASYGGATYWFASEAHRALFQADPAKYAPQFGGYCAYGASRGYPAKVEIETWQVIDGKLYLNYDRDIQRRFNRDVAEYLRKAYANWPGIVAREGR